MHAWCSLAVRTGLPCSDSRYCHKPPAMLPGSCPALAELVPCSCQAIAIVWQRYCHDNARCVATRCPGPCHALARVLPLDSHAVWMPRHGHWLHPGRGRWPRCVSTAWRGLEGAGTALLEDALAVKLSIARVYQRGKPAGHLTESVRTRAV